MKVLAKRKVKLFTIPRSFNFYTHLGPSINGLVTDGNTKLCCRGFISKFTANAIDSEHAQDCKRLLLVCEAEILQVKVNRIEVFSSFLC